MVPRKFRDFFHLGAVGFHASLLPQLRRGAPLNWAILCGLEKSGVSMFVLADGVDDGPIYGQRAFNIGPRAMIGELVSKSREQCTALVRELLPSIVAGTLSPTAQVGRPSYALQRQADDGRLDWNASAESIDRLVRAVSRPYPGASTMLDGTAVQIWETALPQTAPPVFGVPGQLVRLQEIANPCVVTGHGLIEICDASMDSETSALELLRSSSQKRFQGS